MADLNTDVRYIKGIGEQRAKALGKLGIATLRDLISYFPRAYDDRSALRRIADLVPGETAGVAAMVASPPTISHIRKGLDLVKLRAVDDTGTLDVTFFNQAWLKNSLHQGETYIFYGRAEGSLLRHQMANPVVEPEGRREVTGRIVPIYPLTAGVSQLILSRSIRQGLDACADILPDVLPDRVRQHHQLCRIEYAYENIHFPESAEALDLARRRLAFEELFLFTIGLERLRSRREVVHVPPCGGVDMELFYRALPFTLTDAQRRCVEEALADMRSGTPMNRLCQGDVGSGKTMVAAACVYFMVKNGRQAALMAPTEILAQQHYQGLAPLLENLGIRCALLTGSTTAKTKRSITQQLESGEIDFAIGTHALITGSVAYRDLGLVVTDEQHRFGVAQRAELAAKGDHPHILVMSATPIPRTLALILYGDLDVSIIDQLPPGRQPVQTFAVTGGYHQRVYRFIRKLVGEGRQAYIVCPMVEENDQLPDERKAVTEYAKKLQSEVYRADLHYGKHVIQSLVIRIKHKPILRRYIFYSMAVYMKISSTISCMVNFFQHGITLFLCVFIHMRSIPVQHDPIIWYEYNILQYHYNDSFHFQAPFLYAKLPSAIKIFFGSISNHDMKKGHCKIQSSCSSLPSTLHPAYLQFSPHTPGSF